jgi:hypothetical protein
VLSVEAGLSNIPAIVISRGTLNATDDVVLAADQPVCLKHFLLAALFGHREAAIAAGSLCDDVQIKRSEACPDACSVVLSAPAIILVSGVWVSTELPPPSVPTLSGEAARSIGESRIFLRHPIEQGAPIRRGTIRELS